MGFSSKLGMTYIDMADTTHLLLSKTPFEEGTAWISERLIVLTWYHGEPVQVWKLDPGTTRWKAQKLIEHSMQLEL